MIEPCVANATGATGGDALIVAGTVANGTGTSCQWFAPLGLGAPTLSSGVYSATPTYVAYPYLRWLYSAATGYSKYRVTSATLIVRGNLGSTTPGRMTVATSSDPADLFNTAYPAWAGGPNAKTFDLSTLASREQRIPMSFDSSWKKVSSTLAMVANVQPWSGTNTQVVPVSSAADLGFSGYAWRIVGGPASMDCASFYIDYTVEFRDAVSPYTAT